MSILTNLLNKNVDDLLFEEDIKINDIFNKYKNYNNYINKYEKIDIDNNFAIISDDLKIQEDINNKLYDFIKNIYLYIDIDFQENKDNIFLEDIIDYIELKIGNIDAIEKLTINMLEIYFNIYKNKKHKKIFNLINNINSKNNKLYIPIYFYFNLNKNNLIPIHLLYNEKIFITIKFKKKKESIEIKINDIYFIINYIKLDENYNKSILDINKSIKVDNINNKNINTKLDNNTKYIIHKITEYSNPELKEKLSQKIDNDDKLISYILFKINDNNINIENLIITINNQKIKYSINELKYLNLLNTNFNINDNINLYLLNFALFKEKISGFIDISLVKDIIFDLEITHKNLNNLVFSESFNNSFKIKRIGKNDYNSQNGNIPIILSYNTSYNIIDDNNLNITVLTDKNDNTSIYENFINNQLIINDNNITVLYFKSLEKQNLIAKINISNTPSSNFNSEEKLILYIIEYKIYNINKGYITK